MALDYYEEVIRLGLAIGDRDAEMFAKRGLCLVYHYLGDNEQAVRNGEASLAIT